MLFSIFLVTILALVAPEDHVWDPKGYVMFCPCMGRFGNQVDQVLGALRYCKEMDRTCILPHWVSYGEGKKLGTTYLTAFDDYFSVSIASEYTRVILMDDFMRLFAEDYWPQESRWYHCFFRECTPMDGSPGKDYWSNWDIKFSGNKVVQWGEKFSASSYPVLCHGGPPGKFPIQERDRILQKYLEWTPKILHNAKTKVPNVPYIGVHLRVGSDWERSCSHGVGESSWMESVQCLGKGELIQQSLCYPTQIDMANQLNKVAKRHSLRAVYVASDTPKQGLKEFLDNIDSTLKVVVSDLGSQGAQTDLAALGSSEIFIGNCVSSFTAFVKRERDVFGLQSYFWDRTEEIADSEL